MNCQYYDSNFETCKNGDCPYCADFCPVTENQEVCRYSDLDETEIAYRESLDNEKQDSQEALQALAEENQELKKRLAEVLRGIPEFTAADPVPGEMKGPIGTGCPHCGNMEVIWYPEKDVNVCQVCGWTDKQED